MKKILQLVVCLGLVGLSVCFAEDKEQPLQRIDKSSPLTLTITSDKQVYEVGEEIVIDIVIKNNSDNNIWIVKPQEGSEAKVRYPFCYFEVKDSKGELLTTPRSYYKAVAPLMRRGFVQIKPKEDIVLKELYEEEYQFKRLLNPITQLTKNIGKYFISLYYSTDAQAEWQWDGYWEERYNLFIDSEKEFEEAKGIIKEVLRLNLVSNTITLEVVEKKTNNSAQRDDLEDAKQILIGMTDEEIEAYFNECVSKNQIFFYTGSYANIPLVDEKDLDSVRTFNMVSLGCTGGVPEGYKFNKLMLDYIRKNKSESMK